MESVFDILPGIETPVGKVVSTLADIWELNRGDAPGATASFRASQMNLVIHLGLETTPAEGRTRFDEAVRFARRYPCRILVLCPVKSGDDQQLRAKVFAECYVGHGKNEMTCCEAIHLSYAMDSRTFLENQVSTLVESDLPIYYWPIHFFAGRRIQDYLFFVNSAQRIVVDTSSDTEDLLSLPWPRPEAIRDLVFARLLPVRQVLGQFLAGFAPEKLVGDLREATVRFEGSRSAEARALREWLASRLEACGQLANPTRQAVQVGCPVEGLGEGDAIEVLLSYANGESIRWHADFKNGRSEAHSTLGGNAVSLTNSVRLLKPEAALAEAIFF